MCVITSANHLELDSTIKRSVSLLKSILVFSEIITTYRKTLIIRIITKTHNDVVLRGRTSRIEHTQV